MDKKRVLGRGLESLIPAARATAVVVAPAPVVVATQAAESGEMVRQIAVEEIERNPYQTRQRVDEAALEELASSIRSSGIMQPIVIRYIPAGGESAVSGVAKYQLIAGERRWLAAQKAGLKAVPAIIRKCSNEQAMELTIIENLQREDLNPLEQAMAFDRLGREFGLTQEQMAVKTGKDRATIANYVRLLRLPVETQSAITLGQVSLGHAKVMGALDSWEVIIQVTKRILNEGLSVRQTEEVVYELLQPSEKEEKTPKPVDPNVRSAERRLEEALGTRVRIKDRKGRGKVVIEYNSLDDFDRIVEALGVRR